MGILLNDPNFTHHAGHVVKQMAVVGPAAFGIRSHEITDARAGLDNDGVLARDVIDEIAAVMRELTEPLLMSGESLQTRGEM